MITEKMNRKQSVVLFADMLGYSRLMDEDESLALAMRRKMETSIQSLIPEFGGSIIQFYGDGAMCTFSEAQSALRCAAKLQQILRIDPEVPVRMGLHAGEIAYDERNIYGETVNIAARIESFGLPGAVLFSKALAAALPQNTSLNIKKLGLFQLKNIEEPIELYALKGPRLLLPNAHDLIGKGQSLKKSLAVLPFVNMSSDPENEYFSDGIAEEILNVVSKVENLKVTARTSSFSYKGRNEDVRQIGKELGVDTVLEGSVRKAGQRVRITAQLINTEDGYHLFSETFDRTLDDIFAIQDEIALKITDQLKERLGIESRKKKHLVEPPTHNLEAYNAYLRGLFHWSQYSPEEVEKAVGHFQQAIDLDPNFAKPYAILSFCLAFLGGTTEMDHREAFPVARESALKAVELNPQLVEAHCALGLVRMFYDWDFEGAEIYFEKAAGINDQNINYLVTYGLFLIAAGRFPQAIQVLEKALEIDPISFLAHAYLAEALATSGDFDPALMVIAKMEKLFPENVFLSLMKGNTYLMQGNFQKARQTLKRRIDMEAPIFKDYVVARGLAAAGLGDNERYFKCKKRIEGMVPDYPQSDLNIHRAMLAVAVNDVDSMLDNLNQAVEKHLPGMVFVVNHPYWKKIYQDERYKALVDKIQMKGREIN
jgi:adenylate cyclase